MTSEQLRRHRAQQNIECLQKEIQFFVEIVVDALLWMYFINLKKSKKTIALNKQHI
jgi:hypothetical protein